MYVIKNIYQFKNCIINERRFNLKNQKYEEIRDKIDNEIRKMLEEDVVVQDLKKRVVVLECKI